MCVVSYVSMGNLQVQYYFNVALLVFGYNRLPAVSCCFMSVVKSADVCVLQCIMRWIHSAIISAVVTLMIATMVTTSRMHHLSDHITRELVILILLAFLYLLSPVCSALW